VAFEAKKAGILAALRKLGNKNTVEKSTRNQFVFESAAFERWVKTLPVPPVPF